MAAGVTEGAQAMQERLLVTGLLRVVRIDVHRVPVAAQAIQQGLVDVGLLGDHRIGLTIRQRSGRHARNAFQASARSTGVEAGELVVVERYVVLVGGVDFQHADRALAFVQRFFQAHGVLQLGLRRQRTVHLGVLLAMQALGERQLQAFQGRLAREDGLEEHLGRRQHSHGRQHAELFALELVDVEQFGAVQRVLGGAHGQRVERGVVLVVFGFQGSDGVGSHFHVDVLVTTDGVAGHALEQLLEAFGAVGRMHALFVEAGDAFPVLAHQFRAQRIGVQEAAIRALPAIFGVEAATDFEQAAGFRAVFMAQPANQRRDVFDLELGMQLFGEQTAGDHHARGSDRGDGVDANVLARAFDGQRVGETDQAGLGSGVVALAEVAEDAGAGSGHHDAAVALVAHDRPYGVGQAEGAFHVDFLDQVPLLFGHLVERGVAQDAGVVDEDIDGAECLQRGGDDLLALGYRMMVGNRFATHGTNFSDHGVGRCA
ncbi:hypothetical protein D3C81_940070 [compost metagenome]